MINDFGILDCLRVITTIELVQFTIGLSILFSVFFRFLIFLFKKRVN